MKILQISFSNINNLRGGPHVINFDQHPLDHAGIFAILGPTGSGKSTILDVITLALFNQIPRFKDGISNTKITKHGSILNLHSSKAEAKVSYQVKGKRYTSEWKIEKARTGKLKSYEMFIMDERGEYLDLKKTEVPTENEKIIGLNYDQFVKSIILSQGEFSKFLKADKKARGKLLEDITGTSIYRRIGSEAWLKFKEIEKQVNLEFTKLGEIHTLSEDEIKDIKIHIQEAEKLKGERELLIKTHLQLKQVKAEAKSIQQNLKFKKEAKLALVSQFESFKPKQLKLEIHEKISPLHADFKAYLDAKENALETAKNLKQYKSNLEAAEKGLNNSIGRMAELTKKKVQVDNFIQVMSSFEKEIIDLDAQVSNLKEKGKELRARINQKAKQSHLSLNEKIKAEEALTLLKEEQVKIQSTLKAAGYQLNANLEDERKAQNTDRVKFDKLSELVNTHKLFKNHQENEASNNTELHKFKLKLKELLPLHEKCNTALKALEANEQNLLKRKEDAIKIAKLEQLRDELIKGEACPLCGSLEHPYTEHLDQNSEKAIDLEIQANAGKKQKESVHLKKLAGQISSTETQVATLSSRLNEISKSKQQAEKQLKLLKIALGHDQTFEDINLEEKLIAAKERLKTKEQGLEALNRININKELIKDYAQLIEVTKDYQTFAERRKEKFSSDDPSKICNELQNEYQEQLTSKSENLKAIEIESKDLKRAEKILNNTQEKLNPRLPEMGLQSIEELEDHYLEEEVYTNFRKEHENLKQTENSLSTEIKNLELQEQNLQSSDKRPEESLEKIIVDLDKLESERDILVGSIGQKVEQLKQDEAMRARRKGKEAEIERLNKKLEKWALLNKIIGDKKGDRFATFAQGITLKNLLYYSNIRLAKLSDRYLLEKPKDGDDLMVVDQYQGNSERSVATLSGGETFLISLALALSLSDMASKNVPLDSLFIDEGFGTLDQESLDIALTTLEKLQTESQKTVGVISHVEALKERISTQIILEKDAQGYSKIKIES